MSKWISIKDRLPEHNRDVLVCEDDDARVTAVARVVWHSDDERLNEWRVTHWMELPPPPEAL